MVYASGLKQALLVTCLVLVVLFTRPGAERYGDNLQIALPLAGLGCAVASGNGPSYAWRFAGAWLTLHGSKIALGDAAINERPRGGDSGFPSGHTTAAVFGASSLVRTCLDHAPLVKTGVVIAAGYVAGSRIEAGAHDIWQVLAGVILALLWERAFRRGTPEHARASRAWNRIRGRAPSGP